MPIAHRFTASPSLLRSNDTLYDITFGGRALTVSVFHQGTSAAFTVPSTVRQRNPLLRGIWSDWLHIPRACLANILGKDCASFLHTSAAALSPISV